MGFRKPKVSSTSGREDGLSEEDYLKIAAINPRVLDEDSDGGTNITSSEVLSTLGLKQSENSNAVANEIDQWVAYVADHPDLQNTIARNKDSDGSGCRWCTISDVALGKGIAQEGITLSMAGGDPERIPLVMLAAKAKRHYRQHGKGEGRKLRPIGNPTDQNEDIYNALDARELTKSEKRGLMLRRFGDMGFNGFNKVLASTRTAIQELYGKSIDETSAALFIASDVNNTTSLLNEWKKKRSGQEYSLNDIKTELFTDNGDSYSVSPDKVSTTAKMLTPYDFENGGKFFGNTEFRNNSKVRVETEDYYSEKEVPGWYEHPILGTLNKPGSLEDDNPWRYSTEFGWVALDEKNGSDWFFSKSSETWMYPHAHDNGIYFYSKGSGEVPSEGEWLYPNNTGQLYDFNTKQFYDPEDLGAREFERNADPADSIGKDSTTPNANQNEIPGSENTTGNPNQNTGGNDMSESNKMPEGYFTDEWGTYYRPSPTDGKENGFIYRVDGDVQGWWYEDPNSRWMWSEDTGWMWSKKDETGNYFMHQGSGEWVYAREGNWVTPEGEVFNFAAYPQGLKEDSPGQDIDTSEPGNQVPRPISYANQIIENPMAGLSALKRQLNETARELAYEGYDQGLISGILKETEVYKDIMDTFSNDPEQKQYADLVDGIVQQVAEVNSQKHNVATYLDFADYRGMGMLDPRFSLEEKTKIRTAKPSRPATQLDVDQGLADEVGQIIRNPDYDPQLSMYFEYRNPETGELETRAHRSGMPGKAPFAQIQEGLIDSSLSTMQSHLDDLMKPTENGKSLYQNRLDKQIGALRDKGIMAGGEDDPNTPEDESLGLYANQGMKAMNYLFGDDDDSQQGKLEDYNEMQKYIRGKSNFLSNLALKDELDNTSKLRTAMEDFDPIERARQRAVDRTRLARFGGGTSSIRDTSQGLFENDIRPKLGFKDLSKVSGLGDTYTNAELEAAGISGGLADQPTISADMKRDNQYSTSINDLAATNFIGNRGSEKQRR
jgi:hypothetical protein